MPNSRKINVVGNAFARLPTITNHRDVFVGFGESCLFDDSTAHCVGYYSVTPGSPVTLATWWLAQAGRTPSAKFEGYDELVTLNSDGSVTIPPGANLLFSVTLDQTLAPDIAAAAALPNAVPFITGTSGGNPDPNALDDTIPTPVSVPYAILYSGTPTTSIISIVAHKLDVGSTFLIYNSVLQQSPDALPPLLRSVKVNAAKVGKAGRVLALFVTDLSGVPKNITAVDGTKPPIVKVNGTPVTTTQLAWGDNPNQRLAHALLRMTNAVISSDLVTVDLQDSWCATAIDVCGPATGLVASNLVGGSILPAFISNQQTMGIGMNVSNPADMYVTPWINAIRNAADWVGNVANDFTKDANGNITGMGSNTSISCQLLGGFNNPGDSSQTYFQCIPGLYTFGFEGGTYALSSGSGSIVSGPTTINGVTTVSYLFPETAPHFLPAINLVCTSPGIIHYCYPPDPSSPTTKSLDETITKWHPQFLSKIAGFQVLRFMDWLGTNNSNVNEYVDFNTTSTLGYSRLDNRVDKASVVRIESYTDTTNRYAGGLGGVLILVTTSAGHGFPLGPIVNGTLNGFVGPGEVGPTYAGTFPTVSPTDTVSLNGQLSIFDVLTTTTFVVRIRATDVTTAVLANTYTSTDFGVNATASVRTRIGAPPSEAFDLCAETGINPWVNVPTGASDACVTEMFTDGFSRLPNTSTVWVEVGNEVWNFNFLQFTTATILGNIAGQVLSEWVTRRTAAVHALVASAKATTGWGGTLKFVYSAFATNLGIAKTNNFPVHALCINPYFSIQPQSDTFASDYATYTRADRRDLYEFYLMDSDFAGFIKANADALHASYPDALCVAYEWAADSGLLYTADSAANSRANAREPEQYNDILYVLGVFQSNGLRLATWFNLSSPLRDNGSTNFPVYYNADQVDGTGSPSENEFFDDFTTNPVSEVGGALHRWAALVNSNPSGSRRRVYRSRVARPLHFAGSLR
jgi:hypothetical protein